MLPVAARSRRNGSGLCISIDPEEFGELEMMFSGHVKKMQGGLYISSDIRISFFFMTSHVGDAVRSVLPLLQTSVKAAVGGASNLTLMQTSASYLIYPVYHSACGAKKHVFSVFRCTQCDSVHVSRHLEYII